MEKSVQFNRLFLFVCATYQSSNLTIKGTDKSFNLSNVVRPTERAKPKSNLIIAPSLLTDLDRRSQLRNENRSFEGRGKLARAPNPFFRFDLNHGETRRAVRKETRDRAWYRDGRRGIGGFIEHRNQYIYIYPRGFGSGECNRLVNRSGMHTTNHPRRLSASLSKLLSFIE